MMGLMPQAQPVKVERMELVMVVAGILLELAAVAVLVVQRLMVDQVAEATLGMVSWVVTEVTLAAVTLMVRQEEPTEVFVVE